MNEFNTYLKNLDYSHIKDLCVKKGKLRTYRCRMFICPHKRYLYCVNHCVSMEKFLKNIFGGQTGDKISHRKIKKNNKTLSENDTEM